MTYQEMLAKLAEKRNAYKKLSDEIGVKVPTDEQRSAIEGIQSEMEGLRAAIVREEEQRSTDAVITGQIREDVADGAKKSGVEKRKGAINSYLRSGFGGCNADDRKILSELRALNTGAGADGGFTIDTETLATVTQEKVSFGAVAAQARILNTGKGNPITWAVSKEGAVKGVIVGEAQNHGKKATQFGQASLGAFKISSQIILVSDELLTDSEIDMVSYIVDIARNRIDRGINAYAVSGTGTDQPKGLINQLSKTVDIDNAAAFTWETLVDLYHGVDAAYRRQPKAAFGMHDKTLAKIRKFKDDSGDPLYTRDLTSDAPDRVLGMPTIVDNEFPELEAGTGAVVFGDWNAFIIRRVNGMVIKRLDELYAESGQVGFLAFERFDCLLDDTAAFVGLKITA